MRLGAFTTFTPEYTFAEACLLLNAIGYKGVQPRIVADALAGFDPKELIDPWGNNKGGISETAFFSDPVGVLKPARDAGLEVTSLASYASSADLPRAVKIVKACAQAGIRHVRISALPRPKEARFDIWTFYDRARGVYKELVAEAKKVGVRPCVELHMGTAWPTAAGLMMLLKDIPPEDVGVLYDPGNMIAEGWESPSLSLNLLGPYLAEVHVKNTKWVPDSESPRGVRTWKPVGTDLEDGCVNWVQIVEILKVHGYRGWLIEEGHLTGRDTYSRLKKAHELLSGIIHSENRA